MKSFFPALLAGLALLTSAHAGTLDQAATLKALDAATGTHAAGGSRHVLTFDAEMRLNRLADIRDRYEQLLTLHKTGHPTYRPAIDLFIKACKRAIKRHDHLKKLRPEYPDAASKFSSFRPSGDSTTDDAVLQQLRATKAAAESYNREDKQLLDAANKIWKEALERKKVIDAQWQPASPPIP